MVRGSASAPALGSKRPSENGHRLLGGKSEETLPPLKRSWSITELPSDSFALGGGSVGGRSGSRPDSRSGAAANLQKWIGTGAGFPVLSGTSRPTSTRSLETIASRPPSAWIGGSPSASRPASRWQESTTAVSPRVDRVQLLSGVSFSIEVENERVGLHQDGLLQSTMEMSPVFNKMKSKQEEGFTGGEEFERAALGIVSSMGELLSRHSAFEGPFLGRGVVGGSQARGKAGQGTVDEEERERRRERLKAYKMVRKLEPELPPLTLDGTLIKKIPQDILKRNASQALLLAATPSARQEREEARLVIARERQAKALEASQAFESEQREKFEEELRRKQQSVQSFMQKAHAASAARNASSPAQSWLTFYAIHAFAQSLKEEIKLAHMPPNERKAARARARKPKGAQGDTPHLAMASQLNEAMQHECFVKGFGTLVMVFKAKSKITARRRAAQKMCIALKQWRHCGRFFVSMQFYSRTVRKIQQWWRACAKDLKEIRDRIARRWEKLEREQLTRELSKVVEQPAVTTRGANARRKQSFTLSLEDRIDLERVSERARTRFLDHELRARRYSLLPAIGIWEEEMRKWHAAAADLKVTADACGALNLDKKDMAPDSFRWPPERPLYLPPDHPQAEKFGNRCPDNCQGRKGDAEILAMWRAARENPNGGGWKEIPARRTALPGVSSKRTERRKSVHAKQAVDKRRGKTDNEELPFGEPPEEECQRWGVHPRALPGSDGPRDIVRVPVG